MAYMNTLNIINDKGEIRLNLSRQSELQRKGGVRAHVQKEREGKRCLHTIF